MTLTESLPEPVRPRRRAHAAWKRLGMKSRMEFLRRAMRVFLVGAGETDVAARLAPEA